MLLLSDTEFPHSVYIKPSEVELFKLAWENLMESFHIPLDHQTGVFEIMQNFFITLDHHSLYIYEINCSVDALDFLINYSERFEATLKDKKPIEIDSYAKVKFELAALPIELVYPDISQITFKALYQHFRIYDNFLRQSLQPYKSAPSIQVLKGIRSELGSERDDSEQSYVIQQIEHLKGYVNEHLSIELSRKVNYFVFELLYLFNIIRYAGKVGGEQSTKFALADNFTTSKFTPLIMEAKSKSKYITTIVANASKKEQTNS
jgi:hypothetical protein